MNLAERVVSSTAWNLAATGVSTAILFVRSVLLARWLPVEIFGVYGFASAVVITSAILVEFGMGGALLHRSAETENEEETAAVHLTLGLLFSVVWGILLLAGATLWSSGLTRVALYTLILVEMGRQLMQTPRLLLMRRVIHRRLSLIQIINAFFSTAVALGLALWGATLWALLATDVVSLAITAFLLYVWRPVWRPRLGWRPDVVMYYLRFGSRNLAANMLHVLLDRLDDLWVGAYLGQMDLGLYSRAYRFATYPRAVIAAPVNSIVGGTYAELKGNRPVLSQAFFRSNAFIVRLAFGLAGGLFLVSPEFIRIVLGSKWMPMLDTFRLMLIFTMLDPLKSTVGALFVAIGKPTRLAQIRFLQLVVLASGLFGLGFTYGIVGVALVVDLMLLVGIVLLFWQARRHVDFSLSRIFGPPGLALILAIALSRSAITIPGVLGSDWRTGSVKIAVFGIVYAGILLALERDEIRQLHQRLQVTLSNRRHLR